MFRKCQMTKYSKSNLLLKPDEIDSGSNVILYSFPYYSKIKNE